jgi:putative protease
VTQVGDKWFEMESNEDLANSDGLNYICKREVIGLQANVVERKGKVWRVFPNEPMHTLQGLRPNIVISRNRDHAWEQALNKKSAERRISLYATFSETAEGFALTLQDEDGISATANAAFDKQPAKNPSEAECGLHEQLVRFGNTDFELHELTVNWTHPWFIPSSLANKLRREAVEKLEAARLAAYTRLPRKAAAEPPAKYPEESLSFLANVYNKAANDFYKKHGVQLIAAAYESHKEEGEVSLMITRHCIRYSLSLCPKQAKGVIGVQGQVRAEPMTLINGSERLRLEFDCKACEMHVMGKMKKHILKSPPPTVVPVTFHARRV